MHLVLNLKITKVLKNFCAFCGLKKLSQILQIK